MMSGVPRLTSGTLQVSVGFDGEIDGSIDADIDAELEPFSLRRPGCARIAARA